MQSLALLFSGFSLFCALSLSLTHFCYAQYLDRPLARVMGLILLLALSFLQLAHFFWLYAAFDWISSLAYRMTLFAVAPAFFLFSQSLLCPDYPRPKVSHLPWHVFPVFASAFLPYDLCLPAAFIVGGGYLLWLGRSLYALRMERSQFRLEMLLLGVVFVIAVGVCLLGIIRATLPDKLFFSLYAISIGMAFFLVQTALGLRPQLTADVIDSVESTYASSTLAKLDCEAVLLKLQDMMQIERIFVDSQLSLGRLAVRLGITGHQLSELFNARLGKSFSRYLREQRVAAAKQMLSEQPSASVLSVGLSVGFTSQSNFYEAFREIEGMPPGQYRKLRISG